MKKYILLLILAVVSLAAGAQTAEPNRLIVSNLQGRYKAYNIKDIDSLGFYRIDGRVAADVKFLSYTRGEGDESDVLHLSVTRTEACNSFKIAVLPTNTANMFTTDLICATYIEEQGGIGPFYEDFTDGEMKGFDSHFKPNTSYTILTVGYDELGTACEASKAEFTTPAVPLVGNPDVAYEFTEIAPTSVTIKFTPNSDVAGYAICQFEKRGGCEEQFLQWGPFMGFDNIGDMIKQFSFYTYDDVYENTWDNLIPGKEYEYAIQAWDANGTYAPVIYAYATTATLGGTGEAKVDITIGDFGEEDGKTYQWIKFSPNDQTSVYHAAVLTVKGDGTDKTDEEIVEYLESENNPNNPPGVQDPYWDLIGEDNDRWSLEPSTTYIAVAKAKNANNEYGPLTKVEFTTPTSAAGAPAMKSAKKPARISKKASATVPAMVVPKWLKPVKKTGIQIVNK